MGKARRVQEEPRLHEHLLFKGLFYINKSDYINKSENKLNDNETLQSCKKCSGGCEDENKSCAQWAKKVILLSFILTVVVFILFQVFYFWRQPLEITSMCFRATASQESTQIT